MKINHLFRLFIVNCLAWLFLAPFDVFGKTEDQTKKPDIKPSTMVPTPVAPMAQATAEIMGKSGNKLNGRAIFTQIGNHVHVIVHLDKAPSGLLGVHVHEIGDCSDPEAKSAGEHFNPTNEKHGSPTSPSHHVGDLGNIEVKTNGDGTLELDTDKLSLGTDAKNSVLGRAIVIHEKIDDFTSQPAGNSGGRIGCGVIRLTTTVPTPPPSTP